MCPAPGHTLPVTREPCQPATDRENGRALIVVISRDVVAMAEVTRLQWTTCHTTARNADFDWLDEETDPGIRVLMNSTRAQRVAPAYQRAGQEPLGIVVWDCHVILAHRPVAAGDADSDPVSFSDEPVI